MSISTNKRSPEVKILQTFLSEQFRTEKLCSFQLGLHYFNPPPKASSYKRDNDVSYQVGKNLGAEQCVQT